MTRSNLVLWAVLAGSMTLTASAAFAGDDDDAIASIRRSKSSSAAYWLDGGLIHQEICPRKRRVHDYVTCGNRVRERAKEKICRAKGNGLHKYLYRSGDNRPSQSSVYCKGDYGSGDSDSGSGDSGGNDSASDSSYSDRGGSADVSYDEAAGKIQRSKSSSAAYWPDGTLIHLESCPRRSSGVYDYVTCGNRVRDRAKSKICRQNGKGLHKYLYRMGDNRPTTSSAYCKY